MGTVLSLQLCRTDAVLGHVAALAPWASNARKLPHEVQLQGVCARSVSEEFWRLKGISLPMTSPPSLTSRLGKFIDDAVSFGVRVPGSVWPSDSLGFMMLSLPHTLRLLTLVFGNDWDVRAQDGHVHVTAKLDDDACVRKLVHRCFYLYRSGLPECCRLSRRFVACVIRRGLKPCGPAEDDSDDEGRRRTDKKITRRKDSPESTDSECLHSSLNLDSSSSCEHARTLITSDSRGARMTFTS